MADPFGGHYKPNRRRPNAMQRYLGEVEEETPSGNVMEQYLATPAPPVPEPEEDNDNLVKAGGRAIMRGLSGVEETFGETADLIGDATGADWLSGVGEGMSRRGGARAERYRTDIGELGNINNVSDALEYGVEAAGQGVASTIPALGGAAAGAAIGSIFPVVGTAVGGIVGGVVGAWPQITGSIRKEMRDLTGEDTGRGDAISALLGIPLAGLEALTPGKAIERLAAKPMARMVANKTAREIGTATGMGMAREGLTELTQEGLQYTGTRLATGTPIQWDELRSRMIESGVQGAIAGGVIEGGATSARSAYDYMKGQGVPPGGAGVADELDPRDIPEAEYEILEEQEALPPGEPMDGPVEQELPEPPGPRPPQAGPDLSTIGSTVTKMEPGPGGIARTVIGTIEERGGELVVVPTHAVSPLGEEAMSGVLPLTHDWRLEGPSDEELDAAEEAEFEGNAMEQALAEMDGLPESDLSPEQEVQQEVAEEIPSPTAPSVDLVPQATAEVAEVTAETAEGLDVEAAVADLKQRADAIRGGMEKLEAGETLAPIDREELVEQIREDVVGAVDRLQEIEDDPTEDTRSLSQSLVEELGLGEQMEAVQNHPAFRDGDQGQEGEVPEPRKEEVAKKPVTPQIEQDVLEFNKAKIIPTRDGVKAVPIEDNLTPEVDPNRYGSHRVLQEIQGLELTKATDEVLSKLFEYVSTNLGEDDGPRWKELRRLVYDGRKEGEPSTFDADPAVDQMIERLIETDERESLVDVQLAQVEQGITPDYTPEEPPVRKGREPKRLPERTDPGVPAERQTQFKTTMMEVGQELGLLKDGNEAAWETMADEIVTQYVSRGAKAPKGERRKLLKAVTDRLGIKGVTHQAISQFLLPIDPDVPYMKEFDPAGATNWQELQHRKDIARGIRWDPIGGGYLPVTGRMSDSRDLTEDEEQFHDDLLQELSIADPRGTVGFQPTIMGQGPTEAWEPLTPEQIGAMSDEELADKIEEASRATSAQGGVKERQVQHARTEYLRKELQVRKKTAELSKPKEPYPGTNEPQPNEIRHETNGIMSYLNISDEGGALPKRLDQLNTMLAKIAVKGRGNIRVSEAAASVIERLEDEFRTPPIELERLGLAPGLEKLKDLMRNYRLKPAEGVDKNNRFLQTGEGQAFSALYDAFGRALDGNGEYKHELNSLSSVTNKTIAKLAKKMTKVSTQKEEVKTAAKALGIENTVDAWREFVGGSGKVGEATEASELDQMKARKAPETPSVAVSIKTAVTGQPITIEGFRGTGREDKGAVYTNPANTPILSDEATYYALTEKDAQLFGPNVTSTAVSFQNPLVIESDKQWRALTKGAGWAYAIPTFDNPATVPATVKALYDSIAGKGHDGVIVRIPRQPNGMVNEAEAKTLDRVFGMDQLVSLTEAANEAESAPEAATQRGTRAGDVGQGVSEESARQRPETVRSPENEGDSEGGGGTESSVGTGPVRRDAPSPEGESGTTADDGAGVGRVDEESDGDGAGSDVGDRTGAESGGRLGKPLVDNPGTVVGTDLVLHTVEDVGAGGAVTKLRNNLEALQVLRQLTLDDRLPTTDEQGKLARFIGWGMFPNIFRERVAESDRAVVEELHELLDDAQWKAARRSTLNAHYTSPAVVKGIWNLVETLGFAGGRVLEPAVGTGNFIGYRPESLRGSTRMIGVELEPMTARIAGLLYPQQSILNTGFERAALPDNAVDLVIGNPPFGNYSPTYSRKSLPRKLSIHNYFILEALHRLRPGGLLALVTSSHTMDAKGTDMRQEAARLAEFVGAIRLPKGTFRGNAGTSVVADIVIMRKREVALPMDTPIEGGIPWTQVAPWTNERGQTMPLNEYFIAHPENIIGEMVLGRGRHSAEEPMALVRKGYDFDADITRDLDAITSTFPVVYKPAVRELPSIEEASEIAIADEKDGMYKLDKKGALIQRIEGTWETAPIPKSHRARVTSLTKLRERVNTVFETQLGRAPEKEIRDAIDAARREYTAFVKRYGPINKVEKRAQNRFRKDGSQVIRELRPNLKWWMTDPEAHRVIGIEKFDDLTGEAKPAEILLEPVLLRPPPQLTFDNALDALQVTHSELGKVDLDIIAARTGITKVEAIEQLGDHIYQDPTVGTWQPSSMYLAGPVKTKLALAKKATETNPEYARNVRALEAVQPEDLPASRVRMTLGEGWIPVEIYDDFLVSLYENDGGRKGRDFSVSRILSEYKVKTPHWARQTSTEITRWGTPRVGATKILQGALNTRPPVVYDRIGDKSVVNPEETAKAMEKYKAVRAHFEKWSIADSDRAIALLRLYNDLYNDAIPMSFDGSYLTFNRAVATYKGADFKLFPHQFNAAQQYIANGNLYLAHVVGAGKTFAAAAIAIEARRLGLAKKPMIAVPNHMLYQWEREFLAMYPTARLLVADSEAFAKANRKAFVAKAASQDWDAIIIKHSAFDMLDVGTSALERYIDEDLEEFREAMLKAKESVGGREDVKELEKQSARMEKRLAKVTEGMKNEGFTFEETGVDLLIVDEAHTYKNLYLITTQRDVGNVTGSARAASLYYKSRYLDEINPGRGLVFLSGTPVSNSFAEIYTIQRYLQRRELMAKQLHRFDDWIRFFAEKESRLEKTPNGGYKEKSRFLKFRNGVPLWNMLGPRMDVQTQETLQLKRPDIKGGKPEIVSVDPSDELMTYIKVDLAERAKKLGGSWKPEKGEDNMLVITTDGKLAGLDIRLRIPGAPDHSNSKVNNAVGRISEIYHRSTPYSGTQLVFLDAGMPDPNKPERFDLYGDIIGKLEKAGIPTEQIGVARNYDTDERKAQFHQKIRDGEIRVVLSSSALMGAGTNVQTKLVALHRLDVPWTPMLIEQTEGRILRQGNDLYDDGTISDVEIIRYVTKGSYDEQLWTLVLGKGQMIERFFAGGVDEVEEAGKTQLSAAEAMGAAADNPLIPRKIGLETDVRRLNALRRSWKDEQVSLVKRKGLLERTEIPFLERGESEIQQDLADYHEITKTKFAIQVGKTKFTDRPKAAKALETAVRTFANTVSNGEVKQGTLGTFAGGSLVVEVSKAGTRSIVEIGMDRAFVYRREIGLDGTGVGWLTSLENLNKDIPKRAARIEEELRRKRKQLVTVGKEIGSPFEEQATLDGRETELAEVNAALQAMKSELSEEDQSILDEVQKEHRPGDLTPDDEPEGGATLHSYFDPFSASIASAMQIYRRMKRRRQQEREPLVESTIDSVESRIKAAKGLRAPGLVEKARQGVAALKRMTRHYESLDPATDEVIAQIYPKLLQVEHASRWAQAVTYDKLSSITGDLSPAEVDLVARKLILDDIMKDLEAGLYDGHAPPFGFGNNEDGDYAKGRAIEEIDADLAEVDKAIRRNIQVQEALDERQDFVRNLTERLVELDLLDKSVLNDPRYYHRQVLTAYEALEGKPLGTGASDVRNKKKGFQKHRVGGGDFNTRLEEAEFEWVSQAYQQILIREALDAIDKLANLQPQLATMARTQNYVGAELAWRQMHNVKPGEESDIPISPVVLARRMIAMHHQNLYKLIETGAVPPVPQFADVMLGVAEAAQVARANGDPVQYSHPQWFQFLSYLGTSGGPGAMDAAGVFKAISDRDKAMADLLGDDFVTWEDLMPKTHTAWQPEKGNFFYTALTLEERALDEMLARADALKRDDLKAMLVLGGRKPTWAIPAQLADTMDRLGREKDHSTLAKAWRRTISAWKIWQLLNPARVFKYNFNNQVSDAEAGLLFPGIYKHSAQAAADVYSYLTKRGKAPLALQKEMQDLTRLRVLDGGLTSIEITDLAKLPAFKRLAEADPSHFMQMTTLYWQKARLLTVIRENILRVAAYRYFLKSTIDPALPQTFGSSKWEVIQHIKNPQEKAAMLANELIGDYGALSAFGGWARETIMPFFSWIEVSARRYVNLFRNLPREAGGDRSRILKALGLRTAAAGVKTAFMLAYTALLANAFILMVGLWNRMFFGDEEDELSKDSYVGHTLHLILGRKADGTIRWIRVESGFTDFLDWLDLGDYMADVRDVNDGNKTVMDIAQEAVGAPIVKIVNAWEPGTKTGAELLFGRQMFPDPFNPRNIRHKGDYLAKQYSMAWLYRRVMDIPTRPGDGALSLLTQTTDPGEAAYYGIRNRAYDFKESIGKESGGAPSPRGIDNALYYYRTAAKWGEEEQAARWLTKYYEMGGTLARAQQSIKRAEPLGPLAKMDRPAFYKSLDEEELAMLKEAQRWYTEEFKGPAFRVMPTARIPSRQVLEGNR